MNLFCKILGHTWIPLTLAPTQRWFTTKAGHVLAQEEIRGDAIRHLDRCQRCGLERDTGARRHDGDRPRAQGG